jgi:hypothetical protein
MSGNMNMKIYFLILNKTVKENWPDHMEQFRVKGILPSESRYSAADIKMFRANGISTFTIIDNDTYIGPGMGVTSASTSTQVTLRANRVLNWLNSLAILADDKNGQLQAEVKRLGVEKPEFELCLTPQGLAIFEPKANMAFTFSKKMNDESSTYFTQMVDLICPDWALKVLMANSQGRTGKADT